MRKTVIQHVLSRLSATSLRRNPCPLGVSLSYAACGNGVQRAGSPPHQQPVQALSGPHIREERAEALRHRRVRNNRIA